jgi:bifunctional non-homologous end joining protein LigD
LKETSEIATITRHVTKRGTKVYLDYLQNRHGQTIVAPFSVRPLSGATVSMPLLWDEVREGLDSEGSYYEGRGGRMEGLGADPVKPVLGMKPDLGEVLGGWPGVSAGECGSSSGLRVPEALRDHRNTVNVRPT